MSRSSRAIPFLTAGFPLWVLALSVLSLLRPGLLEWNRGWIAPELGMIMLGMGITLEAGDFVRVKRMPLPVLWGIVLQYTVMPAMGWSMAWLFGLPPPLAVGLILVACCPGGTASNVINYLAKADVALSVTMTSISTLVAVVMTPLLTWLIAGSRIGVPAGGLFRDTLVVVILPVVAGVLLRRWLPRFTRRVLPAGPLVSVAFITLIVATIIGGGAKEIREGGAKLFLAVAGLHAGGFLFGYVLALVLTRDVIAARTISIEVGMQNSGLGVVLARSNFADPLTAIPSAISSLFHSLIASALAGIWRRTADRHRMPAAPAPAPAAEGATSRRG